MLGEWDFDKGAVMSLSITERNELEGVVQPALIAFLARCIGMDPDRPGQSAEDRRRELDKKLEFRLQVVSALRTAGRRRRIGARVRRCRCTLRRAIRRPRGPSSTCTFVRTLLRPI